MEIRTDLQKLKTSLVAIAALWHDLGNSSAWFERKLRRQRLVSDPISHEWISCLLFFAYLKSVDATCDQDWLNALESCSFNQKRVILLASNQDPSRFFSDPKLLKNFPVAHFVAWLILSHHNLPGAKATTKFCKNNFAETSLLDLETLFEKLTLQMGYTNNDDKKDVLSFPHGLVFDNQQWREENSKWAKELSCHIDTVKTLCQQKVFYEVLMFSRLSLMLGQQLFINENKTSNLSLAEQLLKVEDYALKVVDTLPAFEKLASYPKEALPPSYEEHVLKDRSCFMFCSGNLRSHWETVYKNAGQLRCSIGVKEALGPWKAERYKWRTSLEQESQVAVVDWTGEVQSSYEVQTGKQAGSVIKSLQELKLLLSPVLIAPIELLFKACDATCGNSYIVPLLRVLGSDLIIHDFDEFGEADLRALSRLAYLCGVCGRKFLLSSAIMAFEEVQGIAFAYMKGWKEHAFLHNKSADIIFDFDSSTDMLCKTKASDVEHFTKAFKRGFGHRAKERASYTNSDLSGTVKIDIDANSGFDSNSAAAATPAFAANHDSSSAAYWDAILGGAQALHQNHYTVDPKTGTKVSFGYVRLNTPEECVAFSKYVSCKYLDGKQSPSAPSILNFKVLPYHPQETMEIRNAKDEYLDRLFYGSDKPQKRLEDSAVRTQLDSDLNATNSTFILVTTYSLDYEFDWAIFEPSRTIVNPIRSLYHHREMARLNASIFDKPEPSNIPNMAILTKSLAGVSIEDAQRPLTVSLTNEPRVQDFTAFFTGTTMLTALAQKLLENPKVPKQ